ncbi:SRPBCC family protein [Prosthecomicrobium sp. N25]|uniref:SRPBCC family protein n=1 Tax=Prosthecomicrobium sp. N25 TaxID=3129254 RepID=UPI003077C2C8
MQMNDSQRIPAPRQAVWAALNDPAVLRACIPGCESLEMTSPTEMTARVTLKVGPVKATFGGKVTLSDIDPPNGYRISGEGSGGVAGFAKGGATVTLAEDGPDATVLTYAVDAQIGGKLAQLGARLIDSTAKKLAGEFFETFAATVGGPSPAEAAAPDGPEPAEAEAAGADATPARKAGWLKGLFGAKTTTAALAAAAVLGAAHPCCAPGDNGALAMLDGAAICGARPLS